MTEQGHNSADQRLRLLVERIEAIEEEQADRAEDKKAVFAEAKAVGYDTKILREIIKFRKMKPDDLRERNAILQTYATSLGLDLL